MPAIRALAKDLGLDPGTIARAYRELGQDGVIDSHQGSGGSYVSTKVAEKHMVERRQDRLKSLVDRMLTDAQNLGFSAEDIEMAFTLRLAERHKTYNGLLTEAVMPEKKERLEFRFSGSHDLAVELLANHVSALYEDMYVTTSFVGSLPGLMVLERGEADIAGAHLVDYETNEFNIPFIKRLMPNETVILVNLMQRMQGLIVAPGNPRHIISVLDLKRPDITFVNRQKGSGTRILFDSKLRKLGIAPASVKGYDHEENTHVAIATAVAQGQADVGIGAQSAASVTHLDFIPLLKERYDLVILEKNLNSPGVQRILEVTQQESFRRMLSSIPGYDLNDTGKTTTVSPG